MQINTFFTQLKGVYVEEMVVMSLSIVENQLFEMLKRKQDRITKIHGGSVGRIYLIYVINIKKKTLYHT